MGEFVFKQNFFGSLIGVHGTFLLFPVCLMLNYIAPPFVSNNAFLWGWNSPTEVCDSKYGIKLDMYLFVLIGSPKINFPSQEIVIFYVDKIGYYPYIDSLTGENLNGGIPQLGCLEKHLEKAKTDISHYVGKKQFGLAVIDWQEWRPTWLRNWHPKDVYKNQSIELTHHRNMQLNSSATAILAKDEFENAGRTFMLETLKLGKLLRPNYLWGYYLFPDCYNHNYNKAGYTGSCPDIEKARNDKLSWLWNESTALFPSVYLNTRISHPQAKLFVRNRVQEAIRVSKVRDVTNPLPVFVYCRPVFTDKYERFLSMDYLVATAGESISLGASGMVMWASVNLSRSLVSQMGVCIRSLSPTSSNLLTLSKSKNVTLTCRIRADCASLMDVEILVMDLPWKVCDTVLGWDPYNHCINLDNYMKNTLNPYIINITLASKMCNQVLCQEKGVCVRKQWNSDDYLHLNPRNFAIEYVKGGKYTISGKPTLQDLQTLSQKFHCSCYANINCKTRDTIDSIDTIKVCVAEDVCIEA